MDREIDGELTNCKLISVNDLTLHPASVMFPEMPPEQFHALAEDVQRNGILKPLTIDTQSRVLDGRHRLRAAQKHGIMEVLAVTVEWSDKKILAYVLSENLHRRHLDETQRAILAARYQSLAPIGEVTEEAAAKTMNIGKRSLQRAKSLERYGCEELKNAVALRTVSLGAASELAKLDQSEQVAVIAEGPMAVREKAALLRGIRLGPKKDSELSRSELQDK